MYITKKTDGCKNNPENSSATKVGEHITSGFAISTIPFFRSIKNKHDTYRGKNLTKFCEFLREHAMKIIHFKKEQWNYYQKSCRNHMEMQKSALFVKKNLSIIIWKMKNIVKLEIIVILEGDIEVLRIAYVI